MHLQFVCVLVHSCVCLCVFKAISVNEKEKPCLILCFFSAHPLNRSTLFLYSAGCKNPQNTQVWHRNYDFFPVNFPHGLFVGLVNYWSKPERPCLFIVLQGIWFITQINNFTYICIFLSDSIKHLAGLWVVLTPNAENCCFKLFRSGTTAVLCSKFILALVLSHADWVQEKRKP